MRVLDKLVRACSGNQKYSTAVLLDIVNKCVTSSLRFFHRVFDELGAVSLIMAYFSCSSFFEDCVASHIRGVAIGGKEIELAHRGPLLILLRRNVASVLHTFNTAGPVSKACSLRATFHGSNFADRSCRPLEAHFR